MFLKIIISFILFSDFALARCRFWTDAGWEGEEFDLSANYMAVNLDDWGIETTFMGHVMSFDSINDELSSAIVDHGCFLEMYEHADFQGAARTVRGDVYNFADIGFNDVASSLKCICSHGRKDPMSYAAPQVH